MEENQSGASYIPRDDGRCCRRGGEGETRTWEPVPVAYRDSNSPIFRADADAYYPCQGWAVLADINGRHILRVYRLGYDHEFFFLPRPENDG